VAAVQQTPPEIVTSTSGFRPARTRPRKGFAPSRISSGDPGRQGDHHHGQRRSCQCHGGGGARRLRYHLKPVNLDDLKVVLRRAAYLRQLERESAAQARQLEDSIRFTDILGSTPKMRDIFSVIQRVARTDATVLCEGESGTGKELVARRCSHA